MSCDPYSESPTLTAEEIGEIQKSHDEHDPHQHFDWDHIAEIHEHRGLLLAAVDGLTGELAKAMAEVERLRQQQREYEFEVMTGRNEQHNRLVVEVERLRAEVERLRAERRERIATAALQGLLAWPGDARFQEGAYKGWTQTAIEYADALIAALDKEDGR